MTAAAGQPLFQRRAGSREPFRRIRRNLPTGIQREQVADVPMPRTGVLAVPQPLLDAAAFHLHGVKFLLEGGVARRIRPQHRAAFLDGGHQCVENLPVHRRRVGQRPAFARRGDIHVAPQVGVVVRHPAVRAVHAQRHLRPVRLHPAQVVEKRQVHLGQVAHLRAPVVHFRVDVDGVLAVPRRVEIVVPNALQIRRQRAGTRASREQIASAARKSAKR